MSQLSTEEVLQSFRGLKVKDSYHQEALTSCELDRSQLKSKITQSKTKFNDNNNSLFSHIADNIFKKQSQEGSIFNSGFKKPPIFVNSQAMFKRIDFQSNKESCFKKPKPLNTKQATEEQGKNVLGGMKQDLNQEPQNKYLHSENSSRQIYQLQNNSSKLNHRNTSPKRQTKKNLFSLNKSSPKVIKSQLKESVEDNQSIQTLSNKPQPKILKLTTQSNQDNILNNTKHINQHITYNINKTRKISPNNELSSIEKNKLNKMSQTINMQRTKRINKQKKQITTSFITYFNTNISKLKIRNPGKKTYQILNIALQNYKKTQQSNFKTR